MGKFKSWYYRTKWNVSEWFYDKSKIYISLNIWAVIKLYMKCCLVFRAPKIAFYKLKPEDSLGSDYFFLETTISDENLGKKWLYINCHELGYKSKWGDLVFEQVPYIVMIWKNKVKYVIGLECPVYQEVFVSNPDTGKLVIKYQQDNTIYWESILDYLYIHKKNCVKVYNNHLWTKPIFNKDKEQKTVYIPLTPFQIFRNKYQRIIANKVNEANEQKYHDIVYSKING